MNEASEWSNLRLSHYAEMPLDGAVIRTDGKQHRAHKPAGFWVSVDGEMDWPGWCQSEQWGLHRLAHRYIVKLKPTSRIIYLDTAEAVREFTHQYQRGGTFAAVDWRSACEGRDGIIIAPYQWDCRMDDLTFWYYGWDCASGCIWNSAVIESVDLDPSWVAPQIPQDELAA